MHDISAKCVAMFAQSNIIVQKFLSTDIKLTVDQNNSDALLATNLKAKPYIQNYVIVSLKGKLSTNACNLVACVGRMLSMRWRVHQLL